MTIRVFQGEREMAADNKVLGQFDLVGIPPAPRGVPQIEVTFDIDANGIVNVSAKDKATGKEQAIRIQASGGLADDEIDRMVKDAEENAEADRQRRELVEARNMADAAVHQVEKSLSELGDKVEADDKQAAEAAIEKVKTAAQGEDVEAIKTAAQELQQTAMKLGEALYKAQQESEEAAGDDGADAAASEGSASDGGTDDVVDADFEEVDDESKGKGA